jgi:hypothetical protein
MKYNATYIRQGGNKEKSIVPLLRVESEMRGGKERRASSPRSAIKATTLRWLVAEVVFWARFPGIFLM